MTSPTDYVSSYKKLILTGVSNTPHTSHVLQGRFQNSSQKLAGGYNILPLFVGGEPTKPTNYKENRKQLMGVSKKPSLLLFLT